jgi:hypothetical protein
MRAFCFEENAVYWLVIKNSWADLAQRAQAELKDVMGRVRVAGAEL